MNKSNSVGGGGDGGVVDTTTTKGEGASSSTAATTTTTTTTTDASSVSGSGGGKKNNSGSSSSSSSSSSSIARVRAAVERLGGPRHRRLLREVDSVVHELARMSMLWGEQWDAAMSRLSKDVAARGRKLREEAHRMDRLRREGTLPLLEMQRILRRKYTAVMRPVVVALEQLMHITCASRPPETPAEQRFNATILPVGRYYPVHFYLSHF